MKIPYFIRELQIEIILSVFSPIP